MKIKLVDYAPTDELMLSVYASISRSRKPLDFTDMDFKSTILHKCINDGHGTVPQMATYWFYIEGITRVCLQQLMRYRMTTSIVNSGRYMEYQNNIVIPTDDDEMSFEIADIVGQYVDNIREEFKGVLAKEDLRMLMPECSTVNLFWKIDGLNVRNFLRQRLSTHAQWEIRQLAQKVYDAIKDVHPTILHGIDKDGNNTLQC